MGCSRYFLTNSIRSANRVSWPVASAFTCRGPRVIVRPASTNEPELTETGIGSPVSGALSIAPVPSTTIPSTGTTSPDRTSTISPGSKAATGVHSSSHGLSIF